MMMCPEHHQPSTLRPAGISKTKLNPDGTGKAYGAFWVCPVQGCRTKQTNLEPGDMTTHGAVPQPSPAMVVPPYQRSPLLANKPAPQATVVKEEVDWDGKDRATYKMSAWKSACDLFSGTGDVVKARTLAKEIYTDIQSARIELTPTTTDEIDVSGIPF